MQGARSVPGDSSARMATTVSCRPPAPTPRCKRPVGHRRPARPVPGRSGGTSFSTMINDMLVPTVPERRGRHGGGRLPGRGSRREGNGKV